MDPCKVFVPVSDSVDDSGHLFGLMWLDCNCFFCTSEGLSQDQSPERSVSLLTSLFDEDQRIRGFLRSLRLLSQWVSHESPLLPRQLGLDGLAFANELSVIVSLGSMRSGYVCNREVSKAG